MGMIFKQSLNNTVVTYLGFGIGALNTLFLYTRFLTDEYFGLVGVILSASAILMPLLAFGIPNSLVKYYSNFQGSASEGGFLTLMLVLPLSFILPIAVVSYIANDAIGGFLSRENNIVRDYVWYIFLIGVAIAYFEVFYAWSKVRMRSVFGNFMKEVFVRAGQTLILFLLYFKAIDVEAFLVSLVLLYLIRTVFMSFYAFSLMPPRWSFKFPDNTGKIISYSAIIILGGSAAVIILEIDRFMINQFIQIENVAYYSVAIYIAMVIAVPSRAMHQIAYPLTAEIMNRGDNKHLKSLYQKTSLTLFVVSGMIFALILLNISDLYALLPDAYRNGMTIVFLIGATKIYDALLGNNNSILYNSDHYRDVLIMGVLLAVITVLMNLWLIPAFGLNGAAIATFLAIFIYNTIKLLYVQLKFRIQPFTMETVKILLLLLILGIPVYFLPTHFHPLVNIVIKSTVFSLLYIAALYRFKISKDIFQILSGFRDRFIP